MVGGGVTAAARELALPRVEVHPGIRRRLLVMAALIFAKWRPWHAMWACLLFGLLQAVALRFQNIDLGGIVIPVQAMDALPYILTVVILAGFVGKAIPPKAGGEPYIKER